jgi:hypothetical protein
MKLPTLLLCGLAAVAQAAPFTPASDSELVQALPNRLSAAARAQRAELARQPQQMGLALATARAAIERARRYGDPRELGLAQAALAPWWAQAQAPPAVRLLRAVVLQSQHQFAAALRDLDELVAEGSQTPHLPLALQAQAGLTRASVLQVTGRLAEARQACLALTGPRFAAMGAALAVPARACVAELRSLQGEPQQAAADLARLASVSPADPWLALLRAELAERMGDKAAAAARYREALQGTATGDLYSRSAYADFLLDQGRNQQALALVEAGEPAQMDADAMQLRRAIALHRLQRPAASAAAQALQARFDAAQMRGENYHGREQARLALEVLGRPESALQWALSNWAQQKEPADALLLQRAAVAAGRPAAAEPVQRLMQQTGWVDRRLVQ